MLTNKRKAHILDVLRREGQAIAKTVAGELDVSEDTIRRDMREMAAEGLLRRVHGGAMPVSPDLPDLTGRQTIATEEKVRLAAAAVKLIRPGQTIFLDGGTTTAAIVAALPRDMMLTVATHSPTIASQLEHHGEIEVILIGGRLYRHSMVSVGSVAAEAIALIRPDIFFLGATAVHPVHGLTTGNFEEAAIKRQIVRQSAATWLPVTADKLDRISPCRILPIEGITGLILPSGLAEETMTPYRAADVALVEA